MEMRYLLFLTVAVSALAQQPPAGASRAVFQKVCGACHPADSFLTGGRSKEEKEALFFCVLCGTLRLCENYCFGWL
jgi:cytochrome c551/c552